MLLLSVFTALLFSLPGACCPSVFKQPDHAVQKPQLPTHNQQQPQKRRPELKLPKPPDQGADSDRADCGQNKSHPAVPCRDRRFRARKPDPFPKYTFGHPVFRIARFAEGAGFHHVQNTTTTTGTRHHQPSQTRLQTARTNRGGMLRRLQPLQGLVCRSQTSSDIVMSCSRMLRSVIEPSSEAGSQLWPFLPASARAAGNARRPDHAGQRPEISTYTR